MKRTSKCWLSPYGEVILCADHRISGKNIIKDVYKEETNKMMDICKYLQEKGWARFCDVLWAIGDSGWVIPKHLTTEQKDKIFELTEEFFWKDSVNFIHCLLIKDNKN